MGQSLLAEPLVWLIGAAEIAFFVFPLVVGPLWATVFPGTGDREPARAR